jgi:hypothetical protein
MTKFIVNNIDTNNPFQTNSRVFNDKFFNKYRNKDNPNIIIINDNEDLPVLIIHRTGNDANPSYSIIRDPDTAQEICTKLGITFNNRKYLISHLERTKSLIFNEDGSFETKDISELGYKNYIEKDGNVRASADIIPSKQIESTINSSEVSQSKELENIIFVNKQPPIDGFLETSEFNNKHFKNIILYGPPGTGKTFKTRELSQNIVGPNSYDEYSSKHQIVFTTFHQSLGYEDFIEGIKPEVDGNNGVTYKVIDGLFKKICIAATASCLNLNNVTFQNGNYSNLFSDIGQYNSLKDLVLEKLRKNFIDVNQSFKSGIPESGHDYKFVVIIDEINRGNISQIFGELITLIEEDKRGGQDNELRAILPYSGEPFIVPPNVYIIGTMNTADRSAEALDTALRRRFVFIEMPPVYEDLNEVEIKDVSIDGINQSLGKLLKTINDRIFALKGKDYEIGHSYFMEIPKEGNQVTAENVYTTINYKILPLLQEYFYNDNVKIMHVLSKYFSVNLLYNVQNKGYRYIKKGFADISDPASDDTFYEVIRPDTQQHEPSEIIKSILED